jgi:PAS domain S-box-containing protein
MMIDVSRYRFETLREDEEFAFSRGRSDDGTLPTILSVAPVSEHPVPGILERFEHEYSLRDELDSDWAARPLVLVREGRPALILEDPGGEPLDRFLGKPMELSQFLRFAVGLVTALSKLHQRGLIHKDIKPANILVNSITGAIRLTGFGIASRLPYRQAPAPPEIIAGTLAYMAPEQTGRMNRSISNRSDLYSCGVTLYQMLTGALPFVAADALGWVHCHVARQPTPPFDRVPVPELLSVLIMKLLAKNAEDRYQTASGLEADLRRCLVEWQSHGRIDRFPLGAHDSSEQLLVPEKLYGREREIDALLAAFDRVVTQRTPELVLVSGYSGVGKSSVVNELHKVLVLPRGLFASGKFDQYKRDIPYTTLAQAFQTLVRQILVKSETEVGQWRQALREALGPNGQLIVNLIPEVEFIVGKQPPLPDLSPQDAQGRFQLVLRQFIGVFARKEHPLTLFFDDLQWLDAATLTLLADLVTHPEVGYLLLVGAYRDNEVGPSHPLLRTLEVIRKAGAKIQEIVLAPLKLDDIGRLVADALHRERDAVSPLSQLVQEKTGGNPFFVIQFLTALAEEKLLAFDPAAAFWIWDLARIRAKGYTDNVVDLMVDKLKRLSDTTQSAIQQLACLGNVVEIATLTLVHAKSEEEIHAALWEAARTGLILRLEASYAFLHDRVQEAAYALIPKGERAAAHLRIGRVLASRTPAEEIEERVFEIVNQLDYGAELMDSREERERVAELNLIAGKRAKTSTAYAAALNYLAAGRALLGEEAWRHRYDLIFSLEYHRAECELLTADLAAAEHRLTLLSQRAGNLTDIAAVARLRLTLFTTLDRSDRAVEVCLEYLERGGVHWSSHPTQTEVRQEYERIWQQLGNRSIEELVDLPLMTDSASYETLEVLTEVVTPALFTDENLLSLVICRMANLSLEHGNSDGSCFAYVWLGMILGPHFGDYRAAFRFGRLGHDLVEKRGLRRYQARAYMSFGNLVIPWTRHIQHGRDLVRRAFDIARKIGDLTFAAYSCNNLNTNLLASGDPLVDVQREAEQGLEFARKARFGLVIDIITAQLRLIQTLRGVTPEFGSFNDEQFDESRFENHLRSDPRLALPECWYWIRKLQARVYAKDHVSAMAAASKAQRLLWTSPSFFEVAEYHLYAALARAAQCDTTSTDEQRQHLEAIAVHYQQLAVWAENCPENFTNRAALVGAEMARIEGRELDAQRLYEQAIRSARDNGFTQNEALANEHAAKFYLARGYDTSGYAYLRNARYCYLRWGALGKVRQLDQSYPHLHQEEASASSTTTIGRSLEQLDLGTVMMSSQAVAGEIVLERLIETLMTIAVEHAGAERGLLIWPDGNQVRIAAEANTGRHGVEVQLQDASATGSDLPDSLLHYVIRTQESVILDDASTENLFSQDEYVRQRGPRSVLCLPLVKQARLVGVLYLENNLAPRVFTPKRLAMLEMLASQAAISLDHARLYADLNRVNTELRRSEAYLAEGEKISHTASWAWNFATGVAYWSQEHFRIFGFDPDKALPSFQMFLQRIHPEDRGRAEQTIDRAVREGSDFEQEYRIVLPDESIKYVHTVGHPVVNEAGVLEFIGTAMDVTDLKRAEEMRATIARERELFAQQRATELARANEALRGCLDALASVPELDDFLGQVMAAITGQLGAISSTLRVRNFDQNTLPLELVFQDGRVMTPDEVKYPERWQSVSLQEQVFPFFLDQPTAILRILDPHSPMPDDYRSYLREFGVKTVLVISLTSRGQANGRLTFRFTEERDFRPEELEIARALATQASLAIHLTRLAKSARQSAILEERNQLAAEIHDSLAQSFTGISLQLGVAEEQLAANEGDPLHQIRRADEIAKFGLAEARRSILSLGSNAIEESGLTTTLQRLVEHSNVAGRLRCVFQFDLIPEEILPPRIQHELLRFAQEAISNAVRHAKPTLVTVTLRWKTPDLILSVKDNGSGISKSSLEKSEGFGLRNMRTRAAQISAKFDIQTAASRGTTILLTVPIPV